MLKVDNLIFRLVVKKALQVRHELNGGPFTMAENKKKNGNKIKKQDDLSDELKEELNGRWRNWAMIVYPSSAPKDWRKKISELHIPWIVSPCHDKDVHADGSPKKPHWHVILVFDDVKSFRQIDEIAKKVNAPHPKHCRSLRGYVRYLIHLDDPNKYQYSQKDIENHGIADIDRYFKNSATDRELLMKIVAYIRDNQVRYYQDLVYYAMAIEDEDWFDAISHNTIFLRAVVQGEHFKYKEYVKKENDELDDWAENKLMLEREKPADKMELSVKVKKLRTKGLTQQAIADTLGIGRQTVIRYLKK